MEVSTYRVVRDALELLDDIANRPTSMGTEDIDNLCEARELLAGIIDYKYDEETNRHEPKG